MLWSLWAAKEAVFKIEMKLNPQTIFAHRRFAVIPVDTDATSGRGRHHNRHYQIWWEQHAEYVHAWAHGRGKNPDMRIKVDHISEPISQTVRTLARNLLADCGFPGAEVTGRPPHVRSNGYDAAADISLSHDGRFGAVVIALQNLGHGHP
jgi:hypothetical protein